MAFPWAPKVVYNTSVTLLFTVSQRIWTPDSQTVGGGRILASGVGVGYKIRRDFICEVTPRFHEQEYPAVAAWLEWAMDNRGTAFVWWFDQADALTAFNVYLDKPTLGEKLGIVRDGMIMTVPVTLRSSAGQRLNPAAIP